jgi:diguanylate cyclase (GGDEF)-like protein
MTSGRDEGATPWQDGASTMPAAHLDASTADQSVVDGDQRTADASQAASERDDADDTGGRLEQLRERAALDRARADSERRHAAAATRARLQEELDGSLLGDLTWSFSRATGWHALTLEIDRSRRGDGRFVLAFLDIDGLKGINDRAGHAAGDLVLRTLAATLRSSLRPFDPIVRFGGDEFVCGIGGADVREVEGRLAGSQRSLYADTGASFSVGLAVLAAGETLEQLTARADTALLDAKASRPD